MSNNNNKKKSISECKPRWALRRMGYDGRETHRPPLLSPIKRKLKMSGHRMAKNCTAWKKVTWCDEMWFRADWSRRQWRQQRESRDLSCLVSSIETCGCGLTVWGMFSWRALRLVEPVERCSNASAYLSSGADNLQPFMATTKPVLSL